MCSPAAGAMIGLNVLGGAEQYQADLAGAKAKKSYYDFLAGQNDTEAATVLKRGEESATSIAETSADNELNLNRSVSRTVGSQRAALGASGVTSDSVTAEDISRDTSRTHQLDVDALRFDADSRIWSARTAASDQATALRNQADQFRHAGQNAEEAGKTAANSSILGTATSVADNWYRWSQTSRGAATVKTRSASKGAGYASAPDYGNA